MVLLSSFERILVCASIITRLDYISVSLVDSTLAEATAGELDMTGVSLADDIVSKFSLICLDLQRMLPKIK